MGVIIPANRLEGVIEKDRTFDIVIFKKTDISSVIDDILDFDLQGDEGEQKTMAYNDEVISRRVLVFVESAFKVDVGIGAMILAFLVFVSVHSVIILINLLISLCVGTKINKKRHSRIIFSLPLRSSDVKKILKEILKEFILGDVKLC